MIDIWKYMRQEQKTCGELSIFYGYFAAVSAFTLFDKNNSGPWVQSVYGAERAHGGDTEIRGGVASHFFYPRQFNRDLFPGFHGGGMDIQISVGEQIQLFLIAEAGVGIEKAAQQDKQDQYGKEKMFFHGRISFFIIL